MSKNFRVKKSEQYKSNLITMLVYPDMEIWDISFGTIKDRVSINVLTNKGL